MNTLQAQINVINGEITTIQGDITDLEADVKDNTDDIKDLNTVCEGLQDKIDNLSCSAVGFFTPFDFTGTSYTNLTASMTPIIGDGLFIPYDQCQDGMAIRITVYTAVQNDQLQDFAFFLTQDTTPNFWYTDANEEEMPVYAAITNRIYVFTLILQKRSLPLTMYNITTSGNGRTFYSTGALNPLTGFGGMPIFFIARWRLGLGVHHFTINNVIVERIAGFQ